jgi:hypothetical protein
MIVTPITNPPKFKLFQGVLHRNPKTFSYDLADMNNLMPHIEEVMKFQKKKLIVKLNW